MYCQTFLVPILTGLFAFHLIEHCMPLLSDVPKGGMTQHNDNNERSDTRAKSTRDLFLWGLVWVSSWTV